MGGGYLNKHLCSACAVVFLVFVIGLSGHAAGSEVAALPDERAIVVPIGFGESLSGEIASTGYMSIHTFHAEANDSVYIRMGAEPSSLEPRLILMGPDGVEINRTEGCTLAELHENLVADGTYTILAGDDRCDTGVHGIFLPYGLFLQRMNNPGNSAEILGKNMNGTISATGAMQTFTFTAGAGDAAYIQMDANSSSLKPMLILFGPDGTEIARTHNYTLAELHEILGADGIYTILAGDDGYETGVYSIFARVTTGAVNAALLQSGEDTTATIAATGGMDTCRFAAAAGKKFSVRMEALASFLEPMLILFRPGGEEINQTQGQMSAEIDAIPDTGVMYALLAGEENDSSGSYI
jgi:hypothetical protein